MNKNIIIGIVVVIAIIGGYFIFKDSGSAVLPLPADTNTMLNDETTSTVSDNQTSDAPTSSEVSNVSVSTVKEFTVTGSNFAFSPSSISVKKGDTIKITFKNSGGMHDWKLDEFGAATKVIASGAEETITFVASKTGSFEYYCSVGQHRAMGMKGTLVVTE